MPTFTTFKPSTSSPTDLTDALVEPGSGISVSNVQFDGGSFSNFDGSGNGFSASIYDGSIADLGIGPGILLTSGDGTPPDSNTQGGYTRLFNESPDGDPDLDTVANDAFSGSEDTTDVTTLEFDFTVSESAAQGGIQFDLVFGSDEYPEFVDSPFVDIAAVFVNGENRALFNNDPNQPLSIISENLDVGNFRDNGAGGPASNPDADIDLEYDGISPRLKISAPVQPGQNTIKIGVADTGDQALDSGLFVSNLTTNTLGGSGLLTEVPGSEDDDTLTGGDGNEFVQAGGGNDFVDPGDGDDAIDLGAGDDTLVGGNGNKSVEPGSGNDSVTTGTGDDTIQSGSGSNTIVGGPGFDKVAYANLDVVSSTQSAGDGGSATVQASDGISVDLVNGTANGGGKSDSLGSIEHVDGSSGADEIIGTAVGNEVTGAAGTDTLIGAKGADAVYGNAGVDEVYGNQGVDEVYGNQGEDLVFGGQGDDLVFGGQDGDDVYGNKEADDVYGNQGDDRVFGGQGDDLVFGGQGDDLIYGNQGDDQIYGNAGTDTLIGGAGQDTFAFFGNGTDTVQDFETGDTIGIQSNVNGTGVEAFEDLEISDVGGNAVIDLGDGANVTVEGVAPSDLTAGDFSFF